MDTKELEMTPVENTPAVCSRRELLQRLGCGGGVLMLIPLLAEPVHGQATSTKGWVSAGKVSRFPLGVPVPVTLPDKRVIFVLQEKGPRYIAFSAHCTHKGVLIQWNPKTARFVCPAHGATFAKDGSRATSPANRPLNAYTLRIQSGQLWITSAAPTKAQPGTGRRNEKGNRERDDDDEGHEEEHHSPRKPGDSDD